MLTVNQPPTYGYTSVHDLPTPPSTSRPSPPLTYQDTFIKSLPPAHQTYTQSPPSQPMSAPHRGLPPPAAMTLPPQQIPPGSAPPPPTHHSTHPHATHPPPPPPHPIVLGGQGHQQSDAWGQLPPPPQQWQGSEDSMRHWLQAKVEYDKRRQEEERTRQESLRLEQRKIEMDMLRTSLSGGVPPPMIPLVFTGMASGGAVPQAAMEWAQQFMPPSQVPRPQLMPPQAPTSPEHQRDAQYHNPAPAQSGGQSGYSYPGSPTRPRGQTVSGVLGRPTILAPGASINAPQQGHGTAPGMSGHPSGQQTQQESQASSTLYFHHWQPPPSQGGNSSNRAGSPSGETPKKRKATGQHQQASPPAHHERFRSPPMFVQSNPSNPPMRGGRRSHTRQTSDVTNFRSTPLHHGRRDSFGGPLRRMSPIRSALPRPQQDYVDSEQSLKSERVETNDGDEMNEPPKHSVSSLLSDEPLHASTRPPMRPRSTTNPSDGYDHGQRQRQGESTPGEVRMRSTREGSPRTRDETGGR